MPANAQLQPATTDRLVALADDERLVEDDIDADRGSDERAGYRVS